MSPIKRTTITAILSDTLVRTRLTGMGKYWAKEVTLDYGSAHPIRVDFVQFDPQNQVSVSGIEKGIFICYEVKSCIEDVFSGHGLNFIGEKNYLVTTMETYKRLIGDCVDKLWEYTHKSRNYGVMVLIPQGADVYKEFENPSEIDPKEKYELAIVQPCHPANRKRSITEMLFCMLRAATNA